MWLLQNSWAFVLYVAASFMLSGTRMGLLFLDHHRAGYVCSIAVYMVSVASMYVRASHSERPPPRCTCTSVGCLQPSHPPAPAPPPRPGTLSTTAVVSTLSTFSSCSCATRCRLWCWASWRPSLPLSSPSWWSAALASNNLRQCRTLKALTLTLRKLWAARVALVYVSLTPFVVSWFGLAWLRTLQCWQRCHLVERKLKRATQSGMAHWNHLPGQRCHADLDWGHGDSLCVACLCSGEGGGWCSNVQPLQIACSQHVLWQMLCRRAA